MRKALLVTTLALSLAGCFTQNTAPNVRDLSMARQAAEGDTITVKKGDTLYGIAWRQNMDFRQLAQLNDIEPPYRLQPGQTLRLNRNGQAAAAPADGGTSQGVQVASAAGGAAASGSAAAAGSGAPDWLAPDTEAIERNRRLRSEPLESAAPPADEAPTSSAAAERPSDSAVAAAVEAGGPVYNYDSPGADGQLSERDLAEREARRRRAEESAARAEPQEAAEEEAPASDGAQTATREPRPAEQPTPPASEPASGPEEGTAVAGEIATKAPERTYEPATDIAWQWPTEGQLVGNFDEGSSITAGIDIAGQKGQPVKAAGPGIVVYSGDGVRGYGNLILIKHNDSFLSAYAHNDTLRVEENDVVETGEVIATMGDTDAENIRLHFEVRQDGQPRDPLDFLPQR